MYLTRLTARCHYTPTDLVCTAKLGVILIIRNYRDAFAASTPEERERRAIESTVWLGTGSAARLLAVDRTRVAAVMVSSDHSGADPQSTAAILFDLSSLSLSPPSLRIHTPLNTHPDAIGVASCLQIDRTKIYVNYWAAGEVDAGGVRDPETGEIMRIPAEAMQGFGLCIRVWDFGVEGR